LSARFAFGTKRVSNSTPLPDGAMSQDTRPKKTRNSFTLQSRKSLITISMSSIISIDNLSIVKATVNKKHYYRLYINQEKIHDFETLAEAIDYLMKEVSNDKRDN
jgi:hypothetical protein